MFDFVIKNIKKHFSLIIIVFGGACFLVSNVLLKEILDDKDYGFYSIVTTYLSLIFIYGLLGFEQVFLRFSHQSKKNVLSTQKQQLVFISIIIICTTLLSFFLFKKEYYNPNVNSFLLFIATLSCVFTLFLFNIFRLNENFVLAQIVSNGWKIALIFIALLFIRSNKIDVALLINILLGVVIFITSLLTFFLLRKIRFNFNKELNIKEITSSFFNFFISITSFSLLLFGDRFLIENKIGIEEFGNYFYLTNIVLAPFTILQNYVGFKQLVNFKNKFNIDLFINFNKKIIAFALALSVVVLAIIFVIYQINILSFNFKKYASTIGLLLLLGIIRLYSSSVIAAFEARTSIVTLKKTNIIVVLFTLIMFVLIIYTCTTINQIVFGFITIWFVRSVILRQFLIRQTLSN